MTAEDGDCDDDNGWVSPDTREICGDGLDNDCDGEFDEDCTPDVIGRTGGCNCASNGSGMGWLGLAMLAGLRRRR